MLHSPNITLSEYTLCVFPLKSVPVVLHTHTRIHAAPAAVV